MKKIKKLFFLLLITFTFVFAGCSEIPDCTKENTLYEKFEYDEETGFCTVYKTIPKDKCGNGIVEDDETYCNCDEDVKKDNPTVGCSGSKGEYLDFACTPEKTCELMQNEKVVTQTKSVEFKNSDVVFRGNFKVNTPFLLDTYDENTIEVDIDFFRAPGESTQVKNLVVRELILENSAGINFGKELYNEKVGTLGQQLKTKNFELALTTKYSKEETLKAKLVVGYDKEYYDSKGELTKTVSMPSETLSVSIGKWQLINHNFK